MNIAVGTPVTNRAWILPAWFNHVEEAFRRAEVDPFYVFTYGTSSDSTLQILHQRMTSGIVETVDEPPNSGMVRSWSASRYLHMVKVRNCLLDLVRDTEPEYFLSLDSDILLHPDAMVNLLETIQGGDSAAVGGKCYLSPDGKHAPNYAYLAGDYGLLRPNQDSGVWRVDVIMAIKLMTEKAYNVDYVTHPQGEDIGWSNACRSQGIKLRWDSRVCSKHVMERSALSEVDVRCGY